MLVCPNRKLPRNVFYFINWNPLSCYLRIRATAISSKTILALRTVCLGSVLMGVWWLKMRKKAKLLQSKDLAKRMSTYDTNNWTHWRQLHLACRWPAITWRFRFIIVVHLVISYRIITKVIYKCRGAYPPVNYVLSWAMGHWAHCGRFE